MESLRQSHHHHHHKVILFPFLAQGHILPFISLAKLLEQRHPPHSITIVSTPTNALTISSILTTTTTISVHHLPFNAADHGLPPHSDNTHCLPSHLLNVLFNATCSLRPHFHRLVSDLRRTTRRLTIIADIFYAWTALVARDHGAFHVTFSTFGGYGITAYMSLWLHLPHIGKAEDQHFTTPGFPSTFLLRRDQLPFTILSAETSNDWLPFMDEQLRLALTSTAWLCNSVDELEPTGLSLLRRFVRAPVWAVGPVERDRPTSGVGPRDPCLEWLDTQHRRSSVLYVCFGSQNTISEDQMMGLARGLEASGHAFLWVVRPPIGFDLKGEFRNEWLPCGFEERMTRSGRGMVVKDWAPQVDILGHVAVGGFLSHCGWNSVLESLKVGVPMVGWPLAAEQFYNSKMMVEEMGVCVELARGVKGGVEWEKVERVVRLVMGSEEGEEMRRRAAEVAVRIGEAVAEGGSSWRALDEFLEMARSYGDGWGPVENDSVDS